MVNIKHIFFDLDHTLWDFDKNSQLTFEQIFKEQEILLNIDVFLEVYIPINFAYWKLYREEKVTKDLLRYKRLKETFDTLNYKASDTLIHQISQDYINYLSNYNHLMDGAVEVLEYLETKYKLHIITNGFEEIQTIKLEKSGISKYFDAVITSESVGVKKPNPKVFNFALETTNAEIEESIMIGDSYEADVMGAINSGMLAIHFNPQEDKQQGILTVNSLVKLKQYL